MVGENHKSKVLQLKEYLHQITNKYGYFKYKSYLKLNIYNLKGNIYKPFHCLKTIFTLLILLIHNLVYVKFVLPNLFVRLSRSQHTYTNIDHVIVSVDSTAHVNQRFGLFLLRARSLTHIE